MEALHEVALSTESNDLVVCVKDNNLVVVQQNEACLKLCGDRLNSECSIGCMELYKSDTSNQWAEWGSRIYRHSFLHGHYFDATVICTSTKIITILQSLQDKYKQAVEYYRSFDLSKRELQIMEMVIKGLPNNIISEELYISVSTLRTHLKNIYTKVKDSGGSVEYLPVERKI